MKPYQGDPMTDMANHRDNQSELARGLQPFDWDTDCGAYVAPSEAAQQARDAGESLEDYVDSYIDAWPFGGTLTDAEADIVRAGMIRAMTGGRE